MEIQSIIPSSTGLNTVIYARVKGEIVYQVAYAYSHANEMLHDPNHQGQWLNGQQMTLNEAIIFVINL